MPSITVEEEVVPSDTPVARPADTVTAGMELAAAKARGNSHVAAGRFQAASQEYWRGLRAYVGGGSDAATLLSNRAQAQLKLEAWAGALRDAAAAVLISPENGKAWDRYGLALSGLEQEQLAARTRCVRGCADAISIPALHDVRTVLQVAFESNAAVARSEATAPELKDLGNQAYKDGEYASAVSLYTAAIVALPLAAEVAAVLSNLALCGLRTGAYHDAVATAGASLRLRRGGKPLHRCASAFALLGEFDLALGLLSRVESLLGEECAADHVESCRKLCADVVFARTWAKDAWPMISLRSASQANILCDWFARDAIVTSSGSRGRGIQTIRDVRPGEVLVVQRPRGLRTGNARTGFAQLKSGLAVAVGDDALLASTLDALGDSNGEVSLEQLLDQLSTRVLPLLLQRPEFVPAAERIKLDQKRVSAIINVNSHGWSLEGSALLESGDIGAVLLKGIPDTALDEDTVELYPAISLINHANEPNCLLLPLAREEQIRAMVVIARFALPAATELTISYSSDPVELKRKWGIEA
eukprot:TRINITY_DN60971_c0_g1_i1.p1 TRINITY_DN60971_c0_g1~~TRINITY_DN60971_c0_g1_i1.p1  ORF type:complete len:531 (+),score=64.86 TRINITY_DN60971_c0_g1_i1:242-1834(+)